MQAVNFGPRTGIRGKGSCPDNNGECYVSFFDQPVPYPNYKIVDTDYTTYSIVYSCGARQFLWILTREPVISDVEYDAILAIAHESLPSFNWDELNTRDVQGSGCTYPRLATEEAFLQ